jgi:hypothetical protein
VAFVCGVYWLLFVATLANDLTRAIRSAGHDDLEHVGNDCLVLEAPQVVCSEVAEDRLRQELS